MAPEQVRGDKEITPRTDVYSLGAILYEMQTGQPPHRAATVTELYAKILTEEAMAPRKLNRAVAAEVETICLTALEKDPAKRYASAKAFAEDLRRFLDGEPIAAKPAGLATRLARKARKYKVATALICVLAVAIVGLVAWTAWRAWAVSRWIAAAEATKDADEAVAAADAGLRLSPQHPRLEAVKSRALAQKQAAEAASSLAKRRQLDEEIDRARRKVGELAAPPSETGLGRPAPLPPSKKEDLWKAEDELADREMDRKLAEARAEEYAQVALRYELTNTTAISVLGELMYERWEKAETERDARSMRVWAQQIDQYDPDRKRRAGMEKRATLELTEEPGDAEAYLFRYEERHRRMIPLPMDARTGKTTEVDLPNVDPLPLTASGEEKKRAREGSAYALAMTEANRVRFPVELAAGPYLVVLRKAGCVDTRYPVLLERGKTARARVELAREEEVPPGFVYVPEGPYLAAYDREAQDFTGEDRKPHEAPVSGFYMARFAVTCGEYMEYLNDRGEHPYDAAFAKSPRTAPQGGQYWSQREGDRIVMGAPFAPDWPVLGISWNDAKAYAAWVTKKRGEGNPSTPLGVKWRFDLPSEEEWEKAAGGVLRWIYPWGDRFDNGFARIVDSRGEYTQPEAIGLFPADESPYGLRDGGGVMRTWTRTPSARAKDAYITKGGTWSALAVWSRAGYRYPFVAPFVLDSGGVRLVAARAHP
jgi:formylglycine-generating enzyme required for sulfatase activity